MHDSVATRRVLVIEEEPLLSMMLEEILLNLGHTIAARGRSLSEAISLAKDADVDVAILDVMIGGGLVYPAADILRDRGIPFILSTGLPPSAIPDRFRGHPLLVKPFDTTGVERALAATLAR